MWLHYKDVIFYSTYANLKSEIHRTYMGYLWWLLEPLLNTVLFYLIFFIFLQHKQPDFVSFLLVGSITWQWLQSSVMLSATSIFDKRTLIKQIYLPKWIFPMVKIFANTWKFFCTFALILLYIWIQGKPPGISYLALPVVMALQLMCITGVSFCLASVTPYLPDLRTVTDTCLRILMLYSGIFFSVDQIPEKYHLWFYANPVAILLEAYRDIILKNQFPHWDRLFYVFLFALVLVPLGISMVHRIDKTVAKVS